MACATRNEINNLTQSKDWRKIMKLLEGGYKGIFLILRILRDSQKEVVSADLAKQLDVSTARIATALNTLERKGFIKRVPSMDDGRKVAIILTPLGNEALAAREKEVNNLVCELFSKLTGDEQIMLFTLLKKLLQ